MHICASQNNWLTYFVNQAILGNNGQYCFFFYRKNKREMGRISWVLKVPLLSRVLYRSVGRATGSTSCFSMGVPTAATSTWRSTQTNSSLSTRGQHRRFAALISVHPLFVLFHRYVLFLWPSGVAVSRGSKQGIRKCKCHLCKQEMNE